MLKCFVNKGWSRKDSERQIERGMKKKTEGREEKDREGEGGDRQKEGNEHRKERRNNADG